MKQLHGKRVFVGLSGGVDSAVTAALLKEAGADVYGVFIKGWYPPELPCTWAEDRRDAMRVAAHLGIPFHTLDASQEYKQSVIDYLIREYGAGRTPNPDIMCNRDVKFGVFYDFAKRRGADFIATGHYAQHEGDSLLRGVDSDKDQSYFLWAISPESLSMTLFPLGDKKKSEVRLLAERFGLPNAEKKDSQGICFLGPVSMDDFLRAELPVQPGIACNEEGKEVGRHDGVLLYTLGERAGLTNALPGPWFVVRKDISGNILVVSKERDQHVPAAAIQLDSSNWFSRPKEGTVSTAQYRYHGPRIEGVLDIEKNVFTPSALLSEPVASGQSLVIYSGNEVVGGGIIR
ncbi:MAG: tRNA 2-thiouridine(34) synthase MnmA [Bacillota bacterium]